MKDYKVENLSYINENKNHFIEYANIAHERYKKNYGNFNNNISSTWYYKYYNITCLTFGSKLYYKLFNDLQKIIRKHSKTKEELWYQSWLNFHTSNEVLDWHIHEDCLFHGYISIDPKETETEFENFKIKNEPGKVYIGPGFKKHKVNVLKPFEGHRITIAFDVISNNEIEISYKKHGIINMNTGYIPIFV